MSEELIDSENMSIEDFEALVDASNDRLRLNTERLEKETVARAEEAARLQEQNAVLRELLERRNRVVAKLSAVLEETEQEERLVAGEIRRVLAPK